ncbi:MAG: PQQ-binding-like beta-propeller repeat protein, partial [Thaumarchaeota archaeon]|nr:PQQ-binding-like beta-propeller repeat protein [Nitrososphaerota archaeon]
VYKRPWQNWPSKEPFYQNPPAAGGIEADIAYDGKNIYVATYNTPSYLKAAPTEGIMIFGAEFLTPPDQVKANTTIYSVDATTGKPKWSYFIDFSGYRGGLTVSGGVLYAGSVDGNLYALDADTGRPLWKKFFGNRLNIPPTVAADAQGKMRLFQLVGGVAANGFGFGQPVPGALMVFGLPDAIPEEQQITKDMIKQAPREVVEEAARELGIVQSAETVSPISYVAVGIGVMLIVIDAHCNCRRTIRKKEESLEKEPFAE